MSRSLTWNLGQTVLVPYQLSASSYTPGYNDGNAALNCFGVKITAST